ncbi:MAG: proline--tRNA ligase [Coriobacteriia bacterium]|nr:proline--tRNA ligase [Coriobacteriia bacterium]
MKMSQLYAPTLKEVPAEAEIPSHKYMLRAGMIRKCASGVYSFLPLAKLVMNKVENIIREEMNATGAQEILMPVMQPAELWHRSGRWDDYGPELMRLKDRHERDFCLGPTHEEVITSLVENELKSYKQLPTTLYQIQVKFRDEIRPRFGLMRGREFMMKDAYSFHTSEESLDETYSVMMDAYRRVCKRCGLEFTEVDADNGQIGGSESCEFMALADSGEAEIAYCDCGWAADAEMLEGEYVCPKCGKKCKTTRGIEVGQVFKLGTKYSESMNINYTGEDGKEHPFVMGCYGIGVTRMMAAAIEQWNDENGIMWDPQIAPAHVVIIPLTETDVTDKLVSDLEAYGIEVCIDDRDERPGFKFKDADLIGWPYQITIGKRSLENNCVEFRDRRESDKKEISIDKIVDVVVNEVQSHIIR